MVKEDYFVSIDIGTEKVVCLIGKRGDVEELNITGIGVRSSKGIKSGGIKDLDAVSNDIKEAVTEAETMALVDVEEAVVSISGKHLRGINSIGTINVTGKEKIGEDEIDKLLMQARNLSIPNDREILYMVPQEYTIDAQSGITNPIGMTGNKLDIKVHIITALTAAIHNLTTCINRAGIEVKAIIPSFIATAETVLTEDEKELGVGLFDIGKGTTDIAFYEKGSIWSSMVIPIGGYYFTSDIAIGLMTSIGEADRIKKKYGTVVIPENEEEKAIEIRTSKGGNKKTIPIDILVDILNPRAKEILGLIKDTLEKQGPLKRMNAGIVITGGSANLSGIEEVAEKVFNIPARVGMPSEGIEGLFDRVRFPEYSVAVGLLLIASRQIIGGKTRKRKSVWEKFKEMLDKF